MKCGRGAREVLCSDSQIIEIREGKGTSHLGPTELSPMVDY